MTASKLAMESHNLSVLIHVSVELVLLVEVLSTARMLAPVSLLLLVDLRHVVLHAGICDKGLRAAFSQTLVRFFSTVGELMSGELVPSAKAFVTAVTGERFQSCVFANVSL